MQELKQAIESKIDNHNMGSQGILREAATQWSKHSLESYADKLLKRALNISRALAEFENEYERLSDE